ncbi:MAG: hypothetical protein ACK5PZ_06655 [Pirellula sp.]|jgi:hypothetical protein
MARQGEFDEADYSFDDEDPNAAWTAYHEAGHCVVAIALGATVRFASISPEQEGRYGEVEIHWPRGATLKDQALAVLAGPVAEMIYRQDTPVMSIAAPWTSDMQQAFALSAGMGEATGKRWSPEKRTAWLGQLISTLRNTLERDDYWAAIAAVSDLLLAHEDLEHEQIVEEVAYWLPDVS